jgi:nitroreductase
VDLTAGGPSGYRGPVPLLDLDPDQLLSTTRAVRKRLDLSCPVPAELIRECVAMALQAPSGSNVVTMQFVVVTDAAKRAAIGAVYKALYAGYKASPNYAGKVVAADPAAQAQQLRVAESADYLGEHMGDAPVLVIACNTGPNREAAVAGMGNVLPAAWSFMLAARARGLGTAWTAMHTAREADVADILAIPYNTVAQAVLTPVAYTRGTRFKPAIRPDPDQIIHWDSW